MKEYNNTSGAIINQFIPWKPLKINCQSLIFSDKTCDEKFVSEYFDWKYVYSDIWALYYMKKIKLI